MKFVIRACPTDSEAYSDGFAIVEINSALREDLLKLQAAMTAACSVDTDIYGLERFDTSPEFYEYTEQTDDALLQELDKRELSLVVLSDEDLCDIEGELNQNYGLIHLHVSPFEGNPYEVSWELNIKHTSVLMYTERVPITLFLDAAEDRLDYPIDSPRKYGIADIPAFLVELNNGDWIRIYAATMEEAEEKAKDAGFTVECIQEDDPEMDVETLEG